MPLPDNGAVWPPPDLECVFDRMAMWSAWYGGDADELAWIYQGHGRQHVVHDRPSQYRGGVVGRLARWFWGQPTPVGEKRAKLHVPLAADIASLSADLLFGEPPTLTAADAKTQDRLTELIDDGVHARLREGAEISAALSGTYLRVVWDREVSPRPWLATAHPDCAVPEWRWDKLAAVTFWRIIEWSDQEVVRHLERHEPGAILHAVYVGTPETLGRRVTLMDFPETAPLADAVSAGDVVETGVDKLTANYVPNVKPNRLWRSIPAAAHLGRSDFAGLEGALDALDETWCADEETEVLTDHGWVGYRDLRESDSVLTLNHDTGLSEWQPVLAVNIFDAKPREMLSIETRSHSSLTTLNHRWPVLRPHYRHGRGTGAGSRKDIAGFDRVFAESGTLKWEDRIPIAADCADIPTEPKYSDALVEAVAWFWTEGHIRRLRDGSQSRNITICQSQAANPDNCDRIRATLTRLFGAPSSEFPRRGRSQVPDAPRWREMKTAGRNMHVSLNAEASDVITALAPARVPTHEFLLSLTRAQLQLFIDTSMLADNSGECALAQKDPASAEAFQFACILVGYSTSIRPVTSRHKQDRYGYQLTQVRMRKMRESSDVRVFYPLKGRSGRGKPRRVKYSGVVWCPTTGNGTWLARRRGTVYFTGNSSWMRDIRLAKSRLIVPNSYLETLGKGQGATWDGDREVLTGLDMLVSAQDNPITENQFAIRVSEHMDTVQQLAEQIIRGSGYSVQSLGMEGEGAVITATEIDARERRSITTRGRKITYWRPELADATETLLLIDKTVFGSNVTPQIPDIEWPAAVADDPLTVAQTAAMLEQAQAASIETRVRMVHRDWDEDQIQAEVRAIREEAKAATISRPMPGQPDTGNEDFADATPDGADGNAPPDGGIAGTPNGRVPTGA